MRPCATSRCKVICGAGVSVWSGNTRGVYPRRDNSPASEPVSVCSRGDPWATRLPLVGGRGGGAVVCGRSFRKAVGHFLKSHRVRPSPHRECGLASGTCAGLRLEGVVCWRGISEVLFRCSLVIHASGPASTRARERRWKPGCPAGSSITTSYGGKLLRAPGPRFTTIVASPLRAVADPRDECYIVTTTTTSKHFASSFWIKPF